MVQVFITKTDIPHNLRCEFIWINIFILLKEIGMIYLFAPFRLAVALSVLRFTPPDYIFVTFKLFVITNIA